MPELATKAEKVGRFLQQIMQEYLPDAHVEEVTLVTFQGRFDVRASMGGQSVYLELDEDLADGFLRTGSSEYEERIRKVVHLSLPVKTF